MTHNELSALPINTLRMMASEFKLGNGRMKKVEYVELLAAHYEALDAIQAAEEAALEENDINAIRKAAAQKAHATRKAKGTAGDAARKAWATRKALALAV